MNKLTEIKECVYVLNHEMTHSRGTFCTAEDKVQAYGLEWIEYLISLLEEKDKALEFYADDKNYEQEKVPYDEDIPTDCYYECPEVLQDKGVRAKKALNTSSNNKGD